jgi:hypothetical protein
LICGGKEGRWKWVWKKETVGHRVGNGVEAVADSLLDLRRERGERNGWG